MNNYPTVSFSYQVKFMFHWTVFKWTKGASSYQVLITDGVSRQHFSSFKQAYTSNKPISLQLGIGLVRL